MAQPLSTLEPDLAVSRLRRSLRPSILRPAILWGGGAAGVLLLIAAAGLWFHYGTAVFFETIAAGFANCF
jgi:hypothetical protein